MKRNRKFEHIEVGHIFLDLNNPRHEPKSSQKEVIETLCKDEQVYILADDIAKNYINPMDVFCVMKVDSNDDNSMYVVKEGNRRLCAIKLLIDPDLAPTSKRKFLEKLADSWTPMDKLFCWIAEDEEEVALWLYRRHGGAVGGIGQRNWDSVQKARHRIGKGKQQVALRYLEWGRRHSLITSEQIKGKITTVTRFVGNPVLKHMLGLHVVKGGEVERNRDFDEFIILAKKFFLDLVTPNSKVSSRANKEKVELYANRDLAKLGGITHNRIAPVPLSHDNKNVSGSSKLKSVRNKGRLPNKMPSQIGYSNEIFQALQDLGVYKLESLYRSICSIPLHQNTPLLTLGVWTLLESLTALAGRKSSIDFVNFINGAIMGKGEFAEKMKQKTLRQILKRLQENGNVTKHDQAVANFNDVQLANDVEAMEELLLACIRLAKDTKGSKGD